MLVLRALAEGRIGWGFWPPGTPLDEIHAASGADQGIWISRADSLDVDFANEDDRDDELEEAKSQSDEEEGEQLSEDESSDVGGQVAVGTGRFGALVISDGEQSEGDEESEDDAS